MGLLKKLFKSNASKPAPESKKPAAAKKAPAQKNKPTQNAKSHGSKRNNGASKATAQNKKPKKDVVETPWNLSDFKVEPQEGKTRFHDLQLPDSVMRGIHESGFQYCSPIQAESLPAALTGRDMIGQAQTGTGKTAAFLLTIFNRLLTVQPEERFASEPRALIIAPTRELALQIGKDAEALGKYTGLNTVTVVGGMNYDSQRKMLRDHVVDVLVATPGRLIDFMRSQDVFLDQVEVLVLDEADRMLDMGFIPDVKRIVRGTPPKEYRQTLLYSATFNFDVRILIDQWTTNPMKVEIEPEQVTTDRV
ncbi:MAG: DEAD/DEAH box helicase, partial [Pseudomonadota bacterium]|nr:DEAD/DEAH box helicase [Pseudomonadota bacterium]